MVKGEGVVLRKRGGFYFFDCLTINKNRVLFYLFVFWAWLNGLGKDQGLVGLGGLCLWIGFREYYK